MFAIKSFLFFMIFFIIFGLAGVAIDIVTHGKYSIRTHLWEGKTVATERVRFWITRAHRTWFYSPIFYLLIALSPLLFLGALAIYLWDVFREYQVVYGANGSRLVIVREAITDSDILGARTHRGSVRHIVGGWFGAVKIDLAGTLYPSGTAPISSFAVKELETRRSLGWSKTMIDGITHIIPPLAGTPGEDEPITVDAS
jgi:hypothetical protein